MDSSHPDPLAPGAAVQLTALAAASVGVLVVAFAAVVWSRRRRGGAIPAVAVAADATVSPLLPGAALIAVLALLAAVVIRQLWPHPELGARLLLGWLMLVVPAVVAWLARARS